MKGEAECEGAKRLATGRLGELTASYDQLAAEGLAAEPPPEVPEPVRRQVRNLLLRLERRKEADGRGPPPGAGP